MSLQATPRTTIRRLPERGVPEREALYAILDEALICHLGFVVDGQPYVIPTIHARSGDRLYVHGSPASRMLRTLKGGIEACVSVTLLDGLVLARSAFHHSMNYRSAVVLGRASEVTDLEEKAHAGACIVDHVAPGRSAEVRGGSERELKATTVLALGLDEASVKVRTGPPKDDEDDMALPVWAGVLPLQVVPQPPVPDPQLAEGIEVTPSVVGWHRP